MLTFHCDSFAYLFYFVEVGGHLLQVRCALDQPLNLQLFQLLHILFVLILRFLQKIEIFPLQRLDMLLDYLVLSHEQAGVRTIAVQVEVEGLWFC